MKYISTTEHAAQIRADLKARGISSRQVSVRSDLYSLGSSIRIEIKDPDVPIGLVRKIAAGHEHVDRDECTGEVLGGCNMYVDVQYSHEAREALANRCIGTVEAAAATLPDPHGTELAPLGAHLWLGRDGPYRWCVRPRRGNGFVTTYCTLRNVAVRLAEEELAKASA